MASSPLEAVHTDIADCGVRQRVPSIRVLCYRHRVRRRMSAVENAGELGDAANASSEIASALNSSEARVFLLGSTVRFLQIAE